MSVLTQRPSGGAKAAAPTSRILPQVNLLPPEVRAARGLRQTKRWLAVSLILVLIVCVVAYGFALAARGLANAELGKAEAVTTRLQSEQTKYKEVPQVLGALDAATTARRLGMSTDVQWKSYIDAIAAVLPDGVSIEQFTATGASPSRGTVGAAVPSTGALEATGVGSIAFTARSLGVPNTAAWINALNAVPGFQS
ncbi:MAG: fimbrial assembly protein, partial [Cellulomonas sp. 14-74-6]